MAAEAGAAAAGAAAGVAAAGAALAAGAAAAVASGEGPTGRASRHGRQAGASASTFMVYVGFVPLLFDMLLL